MGHYFESFDWRRLLADYPLSGEALRKVATLPRERLEELKQARLRAVLQQAWQVPFYRRRWSKAGIRIEDIRTVQDLRAVPPYSKSDLMASIEEFPPFGDFHGIRDWAARDRPPVVVHTTSGTTGQPQILFDDPFARELKCLMWARLHLMQGLRPEDIVQSTYAFGLVQGGHYAREVFLHYTNAMFLPTGTGLETRSSRQVDIMRRFGTTVLIGFPDYLRQLARVAVEEGLDPAKDLKIRMICTQLGQESREHLSAAWGGVEVYDLYGVADVGMISGEVPGSRGMYLMEDAFHVEILDPDTLLEVPDEESGNICVTALSPRSVFPIVRFNTNDVSALARISEDEEFTFRQLLGFRGRSDNMVKLRGINVYPHAVGRLILEHTGTTGEFICKVQKAAGRDTMVVSVEAEGGISDHGALGADIAARLREQLGIELAVEVVEAGSLAPLTEVEARQKPIRLIDLRGREPNAPAPKHSG
jgi:phenylacetate-CoA ligase